MREDEKTDYGYGKIYL